MTLAALISFTLLSIGWSLWVRRLTWRCSWEVAATLNIALQGLAVILISPPASATLGVWLHSLTGQWNLEDYLGHDCYIVAASAVAFNVVSRLDDEATSKRNFILYIQTPATLCVPLLLVLFTHSRAVKVYAPDFFQLASTLHLDEYWFVLCLMLIWLLGYSAKQTLVLREDPASRRVANFYLAASLCGIGACLIRLITLFLPQRVQQSLEGSIGIWVFACGCGAIFALASGYSWWRKTSHLKVRMWRAIGRGRLTGELQAKSVR